MIKNLSLRHSAKTISTPKKTKRLNRYITKINKLFNANLISNSWLAKKLWRPHKITANDILICNDWQFKRSFQPTLINHFNGKKVLLVRNIVDANFMHSIEGIFDKVYSFDAAQCQAFGMDYMNQFFPYGVDDAKRLHEQLAAPSSASKCFFLGRDKGRTDAIESIAEKLGHVDCIADFHIVTDDKTQRHSQYHVDEGLSYDENIRKSINATVLADINQAGQSGITLRVLESMFFNKKLITSNPTIAAHDFFRPENIFIIDHHHPDNLEAFINSKATALPNEVLHQYSPDYMLETITRDTTCTART
ncbi:hypothetical protein D3C77_425620 [compost metagenome]